MELSKKISLILEDMEEERMTLKKNINNIIVAAKEIEYINTFEQWLAIKATQKLEIIDALFVPNETIKKGDVLNILNVSIRKDKINNYIIVDFIVNGNKEMFYTIGYKIDINENGLRDCMLAKHTPFTFKKINQK